MINLHRCITLMSRERLGITAEEFFILMLFYTRNIPDLYRFAWEVPQVWMDGDRNKKAISEKAFQGLVEKGYLKENSDWKDGLDLFIDKYELNRETFEKDIMDSRMAADQIFDMYPPAMQMNGSSFTSRNISRLEVEQILLQTIGHTTLDTDKTYRDSKGARRSGKVMREMSLQKVDYEKFLEVRAGTETYLYKVKNGLINPMALEKFLKSEMWDLKAQETSEKEGIIDYSQDV